jgi:hypothetical protein
MIIDSQVYVGTSLFDYGQEAIVLLQRMDRLGIDRAVVCPVKPRHYDLVASNTDVARLLQQFPDRFFALARVDPWQRTTGPAPDLCGGTRPSPPD